MRDSRIYMSYSYEDHTKALIIKERLQSVGLDVIANDFSFGENISKDINYKISSSDYFIILLSEHTNSNEWVNFEINSILKDFHYRDVIVIPILISKVKKPSSLKEYKTYNLYEDFEKNLKKLSSYLKNVVYLDFDMISGYEFEQLIADLLRKLNFKVQQPQVHAQRGSEIDIIASSTNKNSLLGTFTTKWIIECKFYKNSRIDLSSIKKLSSHLLNDYPNYNGILITNSLITSTVLETLEIIKKKEKVNIEVVDGRKLKQLILKYPKLIEKYFVERRGF